MAEEGKEGLTPEQGPKKNTEFEKSPSPSEFKNWLVSEENLKSITNDTLKTFIEFTGGIEPEHLKATSILNNINRLQDLVLNGKISKTDADKLIPKFHEQLRNLTERDKKQKLDSEERFVESMNEAQRKAKTEQISLDLPQVDAKAPSLEKEKQIENQRAYVRYFLDSIENSNRDSHDFAISYITNAFESSLRNMEPSIRDEVEARLSLHDSSELIRQANGWIARDPNKVGPGYTIGSAAAEALRRGHDLTRKKIKVLLETYNSKTREGIPNLKIAGAWDLLQKAVFNYKDFLTKMGLKESVEFLDDEASQGKVPSNFYTDSDSSRKEVVREYLVKQLGGGEVGRKSLQLAEKLTIASLETSIFNKSFTGNDELAEIVNLKDWRKGRAETGRARGPKIHEDAIPGFGKSWLRDITGKSTDTALTAEEILNNMGKIREGSYSYFCSVIVTRYYLLKELLLDRAPKPRSIDKNSLQTAVVYFNTADNPQGEAKCGPLKLRALWLLGTVDMALAKEDLEWNALAFRELKKAAIFEELSPKAGSFITQEQWNWIEQKTNFARRLRGLFAYRVARNALEKLKL